jgi:hypothetical protein
MKFNNNKKNKILNIYKDMPVSKSKVKPKTKAKKARS